MSRAAEPVRGPLRVLMLCHSHYEEDTRIRREAEALASAGHHVEVLALGRPGSGSVAWVRGVRVRRLPVQHVQGHGIVGYLVEYLSFFMLALASVLKVLTDRRPDVVQVHTLPDFLVFAALPARWMGTPVILDMHEAMPPFFAVRFKAFNRRFASRLITLVERLSVRCADVIITVNDTLRDRLIGIGIEADRVVTVLNTPDLSVFDASAYPARSFMSGGTLRLVYAGSLTPLYEVRVMLEAIARIHSDPPSESADLNVHLDILGRGDSEPELRRLVERLGLTENVQFHDRVAVEEVPAWIAGADVGVAPTRRDPYTEMSISTKLFEYVAMGKPVIASRLRTVERYFDDRAITFYEPGDPASAADAIRLIAADESRRRESTRAAEVTLGSRSWGKQAAEYRRLVEALARG